MLPSPRRSKRNLLLDLLEDSRLGALPCFLPGDSKGGKSISIVFLLTGVELVDCLGGEAGFLRGRPGLLVLGILDGLRARFVIAWLMNVMVVW